ncbi:hypothetical protein BYT27DRAFT_7185393 [Phlegmacium glaucopus]|nr:hypothetical protein BYT27DRAFT_7185393 [Phlegmacium glaucopus]
MCPSVSNLKLLLVSSLVLNLINVINVKSLITFYPYILTPLHKFPLHSRVSGGIVPSA